MINSNAVIAKQKMNTLNAKQQNKKTSSLSSSSAVAAAAAAAAAAATEWLRGAGIICAFCIAFTDILCVLIMFFS